MQFINYSNLDSPMMGKVSREQLVSALLEHETKNKSRVNKLVEGLGEEVEFSTAISLFTNKLKATTVLSVVEKKEVVVEAAPEKTLTWESVLENVEAINEARSINKIQKEWNNVTAMMKDTVEAWKGAEGKEKEDLKDELKTLTISKNKLEAELDDAVGLKDVDAELVDEGTAYKDVLDKSGNTFKPGRKYKTDTYGIVTFIRFDKDDKYMHLKSDEMGKIKTSIDNAKGMQLNESVVNEAFYRMAGDTIENELYAAHTSLDTFYSRLKNGNDADPNELSTIIGLLKKCERMIKKFNKPEDVKGTVYESEVNEEWFGPFVFNDKMSDDELKSMYDGAIDGYAYHTKGMQYPKSDYKKAYQAIEKILKKRGISVDESEVTENASSSQIKKDIKTKEYKEISNAIDRAEEVSDIWNMLDPKMFKFTESEFEDIFGEWWNNQTGYDSLGDFSRNAMMKDAHSLYLHLLPYVTESEVTEKLKVGDELTMKSNGKKGKVIKVMSDMVNVDFGNGDVYGIVLRRINNGIISESSVTEAKIDKMSKAWYYEEVNIPGFDSTKNTIKADKDSTKAASALVAYWEKGKSFEKSGFTVSDESAFDLSKANVDDTIKVTLIDGKVDKDYKVKMQIRSLNGESPYIYTWVFRVG